MKYRALFLDVDGTTVTHGVDNLPSIRVTEAIRSCIKKGIFVNFATSRPLSVMMNILAHVDINGYSIISSGSQIYDPKSQRIIIEHEFPKSIMHVILSLAKRFGVKVIVFDGEKEVIYDGVQEPDKVVGMYFPELTHKVYKELHTQLVRKQGISLHRMEAWDPKLICLDIVSDRASKLHGIIEVCKLLNVKKEDIVGVGDGYNDYPLLMACGLKIAMGNAVQELKDVADFVAPSVSDDGLATVIEKFILL